MTESRRLDRPAPAGTPNRAPERSLAEEMGEVADDLRQLHTDFGYRPYRVFAVVIEHSGGEVGRGDPKVVSEVELLPTPLVRFPGVRTKLSSAGKNEKGPIEIREISTRYTETQLQQMFHVKPLTKGQEGFYEVRRDSRDGEPIRRRYAIRGIPEHDAENHQWILRLSVQDQARTSSGQPNPVGRRKWQP